MSAVMSEATMEPNTVYHMDALALLRALPEESVNCIVTSPPYFGLRDYGVDGQIGLEPTPQAFVAALVGVFREARRVLRRDGTCWINLGDSYSSIGHVKSSSGYGTTGLAGGKAQEHHPLKRENNGTGKHKDLIGIPWRVAFALQDDDWTLRSEIIWAKPNPMPESVTDRPTKAHEYVFLLTKSPRYWYDAEAIREATGNEASLDDYERGKEHGMRRSDDLVNYGMTTRNGEGIYGAARLTHPNGRNKRSVWTVATQPTPEAHFATFPRKLIEPMILAGCPAGGLVLDPFMGSGTTALVARQLGRNYIGCDLNADYVAMANRRLAQPYTPNMFEALPAGARAGDGMP